VNPNGDERPDPSLPISGEEEWYEAMVKAAEELSNGQVIVRVLASAATIIAVVLLSVTLV